MAVCAQEKRPHLHVTVGQRRARRVRPSVSAPRRPNRWTVSEPVTRLADAGVDLEVDDSKASGEYANGARLDPGADSRDSRRTDAPPTGSHGDAVASDVVCPRSDCSLP